MGFKTTHILCTLISISCVTTDAVYLTTKPIKNNTALLNSLSKDVMFCLSRKKSFSPLETLVAMFTCIGNHISHCLWAKRHIYHVDQLFLPERITYCGVIASVRRTWSVFSEQINIIVAKKHSINLHFLIFNFEWVRYECEEHGLTVHDIANRNRFCGIRLPWIILTTGPSVQLEITALPNKNYDFRMSYTHYKKQWLSVIYHKYTSLDERPLLKLSVMTDILIWYDYYLLVDPDHTMQIELQYTYSENLNVLFYDGPGEKSKILFEIDDSQNDTKASVSTTAYLAMVRFDIWMDFKINITSLRNADILCGMNYTDNSINLKSTHTQPMRCGHYSRNTHLKSVRSLEVKDVYAILHIHDFMFNGPLTITGESNNNCQYGGLFIVENSDSKNKFICENRQNYKIYSNATNILFFLIWYPKYSNYWLKAHLKTGTCSSKYVTFANSFKHSIDNAVFVTDLFHCQLMICTPSDTKHRSAYCKFHISGSFGPVGAAKILVRQDYSLKQCFDFKTDAAVFKIKANYIENWPIGKVRNMSITRMSSERFHYFFHYLNSMTIVFPYICSERHSMKQMSLVVKLSMCKLTTRGLILNPINRVHQLSSECNNIRLPVTFYFKNSPNFTKSNNQVSVFQKEGDRKHVGRYISVRYEDCPEDCRNFTYTLLIWNKDKQSIYEYTSSVGAEIFTGYFYHGLKLIITSPLQTCGTHLACEISYSSYKSHYNVGRNPAKRVISRNMRKWYFIERRYVIIIIKIV